MVSFSLLIPTSSALGLFYKKHTICSESSVDFKLPIPDVPEGYIGRYYDLQHLPPGLDAMGGSLVRDKSGQLELVIDEFVWRENRKMVWLGKQVCLDSVINRSYEIMDVFISPPLSGNEIVPDKCFIGENEVNFSDGLGYLKKNKSITVGTISGYLVEILYIYNIDFEKQKFVFPNTENWVCIADLGSRP